MHSHLDALQAMGPVNFRRVASEVHSVAKQASFYIAWGAHFWGFWKAKWFPKFDFWGFFFDVIFHCVWASNFGRFFEAPNQKNNDFPQGNKYFCKICVFDKNTQIARFCLCFQNPKRRKSVQNSNPKTCCFEASNLQGFSINFRCILESKDHQKIANIRN